MKADPRAQAALLQLQAIDTRLDQLEHARTRLPEHAELADLQAKAEVIDAELIRARTELSDIQSEVRRADADVQQVRDRAARDQARLDAGTGTPKDLQALQHEVESLARRQNDLEEIELEVMERAEATESDVRELEAGRLRLATSIDEVTRRRDAELQRIADEAGEVGSGRADTLAAVGDELVALYERIRASSGGLAAAALRQRRCGGCQLELNTVDINRIAAAAEDEVLRCEECRRILVRTDESGL